MRFPALLFCAIAALLLSFSLYSQDTREIELKAQEILATVDNILKYPDGLLKGKMMHVTPDGRSFSFSLDGAITRDDFLFVVSSSERGDQFKILYNLGGEDIWVYNVLSLQTFHKIDVDKFDPVMGTNFNFSDLSNADFQSNYTAHIDGPAVVKEKEALRLTLVPIFKKGLYGKLTLYVAKDKYIPLRIDYHDQDKVIIKTMSIVQGIEFAKRVFPVRYDMMDVRKGTLSILNFTGLDDRVTFKKDIFRHENLRSN